MFVCRVCLIHEPCVQEDTRFEAGEQMLLGDLMQKSLYKIMVTPQKSIQYLNSLNPPSHLTFVSKGRNL